MQDKKSAEVKPKEENRFLSGKPFTLQQAIFIAALMLCLSPFITPPFALALGILITNASGNPYQALTPKATSLLLRISVVGLGFGINFHTALQAGKEGFLFTILSITVTVLLGTFLGKWLKVNAKTSHLIASGTAICGGSAIAAISPIIKAEEKQISVAVGTVFILNAIALFAFPSIGHWFDLSQKQFGLWSAIAIHDTSSVVGAANKYGSEALQVATVVKLARTLWIIPMALVTSLQFKGGSGKIKMPYFIGFFILAMLIHTYIPQSNLIAPFIVSLSKTGLTLALFFVGAGLTKETLRSLGLKPLLQGFILWVFISILSLYAVIHFS